MDFTFLTRENATDLAYRQFTGKDSLPTVIFCGGFRSDMEGTKAAFLDEACRKRGQSYIRFDYRGHGKSQRAFKDGTIGLWLEDTLAIIDMLSKGKIILVGSSMGGWISLLATIKRKERVQGLIGLAAAPDFTREIRDLMNPQQHTQMNKDGYCLVPSDYGEPYPITAALLEDGENPILLEREIIIDGHVRLIQGMKDTDVAWQTAHRISNALHTQDKKVYLREEGDHRLSTPEDLALLDKLIVELSA